MGTANDGEKAMYLDILPIALFWGAVALIGAVAAAKAAEVLGDLIGF